MARAGLTSALLVATLRFVRTAFLALVLATAACGSEPTPAASPVVGKTTNPPGDVVDVSAHPELIARCAFQRGTENDTDCMCLTECPEGMVGKEGACVQTVSSTVVVYYGGACKTEPAEIDREYGCEVPAWPLFRCEPGQFR